MTCFFLLKLKPDEKEGVRCLLFCDWGWERHRQESECMCKGIIKWVRKRKRDTEDGVCVSRIERVKMCV